MYDAIIVGGGPAGLSAALVLGRCLRRVLVVDAAAPRNAASRGLHGFLSRDGLPPQRLLALGREEIARYGVEYRQETVVAARCRSGENGTSTQFEIELRGGRTERCRKLLLATGLADEVPEFPGARECYGVSVHHCPYCDGWEHRGERLAACGRSATAAAGLGQSLRTWAERVTVFTDGETLSDAERRLLSSRQIACEESPIERLVHDGPQLQAIVLAAGRTVEVEALFFNTRQWEPSGLMKMLGCEFAASPAAELPQTRVRQRTCVPGLFLAGDADGDVQFVVVAAAEGATAAVAINGELQEESLVCELPAAPPKGRESAASRPTVAAHRPSG